MTKTHKKARKQSLARRVTSNPLSQADFDVVISLIAAVNTALIDLCRHIGEHINQRITVDGWWQGTVEALAAHVQKSHPSASGFLSRSLAHLPRPDCSIVLRDRRGS